MADVASDAPGLPTAGVILAGATVFTAVLLVPRAGPWLALVLLAVASFWGYGGQVSAGAPGPSPLEDENEASTAPPASDAEVEETVAPRPRRALLLLARGVLALAASPTLVAPLLVRNRGYALPPAGAF